MSKAESQQRWLAKAENKDYWRGAENVERVRTWRKAHPGYWKWPVRRAALQDDCPVRPAEEESRAAPLRVPLQDDCVPRDPFLVGLIATLAQSALQEDIVATCRCLVAKGRGILGKMDEGGGGRFSTQAKRRKRPAR